MAKFKVSGKSVNQVRDMLRRSLTAVDMTGGGKMTDGRNGHGIKTKYTRVTKAEYLFKLTES